MEILVKKTVLCIEKNIGHYKIYFPSISHPIIHSFLNTIIMFSGYSLNLQNVKVITLNIL